MSSQPTECPQGSNAREYLDNISAAVGGINVQLAQISCGYCGKSDGKMSKCSVCKNANYCSKECQKLAWKKHKPRCNEMKKERKDAKSKGLSGRSKSGLSLDTAQVGVRTAASGHGSVALTVSPYPAMIPHNYSTKNNDNPHANAYDVSFRSLDELDPSLQFVLACTFLNDLAKAQSILPTVLQGIPNGCSISDLRVAGPDFFLLDLASRFGNYEVVEWLCTDERTRCVVESGTPVAWAVYTGQVEVAKLLVSHGADPTATSTVCFGEKPPLFMAAENGQLVAMKWLVEELGQDLNMRSPVHGTVLDACKAKGFGRSNMLDSHRACSDWVHSKR